MAISDDCHRQLPEDILLEILIRLPVKSLLRSKCVCKSWYNLLQSPNFTQTHIRFQKLHKKGAIFVQYFSDETENHSYALFPDETLACDAYHDIDYVRGSVKAVIDGSVNGLFCLFNCEDRFLIWNPAIREFRTLPYHDQRYLPPHPLADLCSFGFGLDPLTDEWKVVLIRQLFNPEKRADVLYVTLYTPSCNSWRHLDGLDYLTDADSLPCALTCGKHVDGVYYWWTGSAVLAFDMGTDVFRVIPAPFILSCEFDRYCCNVSLFGSERLALYRLVYVPEREDDKWCDVWVMEVDGSWIKQFTVGPLSGFVQPMGFWKNGKLLFLANSDQSCRDSQLVMHNPCTQQNRHFEPKGWCGTFQALLYHETLVSVKGGMYLRKGKLTDSVATRYLFQRDPRPEFMSELVEYMREFQIVKEEEWEPTPNVFLRQPKVYRLLSRVWDACEYSVDQLI